MNSLNLPLQGKTVVIAVKAFQPQYQALPYRVWEVTGGFGASPMTSGQALFCRSLLTDERVRFDGMYVERLATADDLATVERAQARLSS